MLAGASADTSEDIPAAICSRAGRKYQKSSNAQGGVDEIKIKA